MQTVNGLVEVVADGIQFFFQRDHVCQKVVDALVTVIDVDGLAEDGFANVFREFAAGGLPE
jgi:hypothetical protein